MSRIHKLEIIYKEQLKEKDIKDTSIFIQSVIEADITRGKYARFLIECFLNDKFLEEDLIGGLESTIGQAINLFDKHKGKLPLEYRSVYALNPETGEALYQSPGDLWNSVKQFQGDLSGKELKKEEQEKIYRETEFVYKDEETGFQIISPLTEESAKWWGKGTRWCTSAENNNMFWNYAKQAPLFILLMPASANTAGNGEKLQLWNNGNDIQFMDEADKTVPLDYIEQNWNILEPICLWLNSLQYIPEYLRTKEICELSVKQDGLALEYVPESLMTKELCEMAIRQNSEALIHVPEALKTSKLCELAIGQDGEALRYVPYKLRTKELYELAIKNNGKALAYLPEYLITEEFCKLTVKQNGNILLYVPHSLRTKELCEIAIKQNGMSLLFVPHEYKTPEFCEIAVQQDGSSLHYVPEKYRTKELCELAVQQNGLALEYVFNEKRTKELCDIAIRQNVDAVKYVPEKYKVYTEIYKLECQQKKKEEVFINTKDKHQIIYQKLKEYFPEKRISLDLK